MGRVGLQLSRRRREAMRWLPEPMASPEDGRRACVGDLFPHHATVSLWLPYHRHSPVSLMMGPISMYFCPFKVMIPVT